MVKNQTVRACYIDAGDEVSQFLQEDAERQMRWSIYVHDDERAPERLDGDKLNLERNWCESAEHQQTDIDVVTVDEGQAAPPNLPMIDSLRWTYIDENPGGATSAMIAGGAYVESAVIYNVSQVGGFVYSRADTERAELQVVGADTFALTGRDRIRISFHTST